MDTMMLSRASYRYVQNRSRNGKDCVKGNQARFCVTVVGSVTVEKWRDRIQRNRKGTQSFSGIRHFCGFDNFTFGLLDG